MPPERDPQEAQVADPREKASSHNVRILQAYGAEIDYVNEPDPETGELLPARLNRVRQILAELDHGFWPNQYASLHNSGFHYRTTMREIAAALSCKVGYVFISVRNSRKKAIPPGGCRWFRRSGG